MLSRLYDHYLYHKKQYQPVQSILDKPETQPSSIEDIISQDSKETLDKVKQSALSIAYRIKIHDSIDRQFGYSWYATRKEFCELETFYPSKHQGSERRRSTLTSDLLRLYKNRHDEALQCWKDVKEEMRYFIHLFHQYKSFKGDKKLLEE